MDDLTVLPPDIALAESMRDAGISPYRRGTGAEGLAGAAIIEFLAARGYVLVGKGATPLDVDAERLAAGIAYAMTRTALPAWDETAKQYADRLAPLVTESGWLTQ